jgi:hypothetical protein
VVELIEPGLLWVDENYDAFLENFHVFHGNVDNVPEDSMLQKGKENLLASLKQSFQIQGPIEPTHHALNRISDVRLMTTPIHINHGPPGSICLRQNLNIPSTQGQRIILQRPLESQREAELVLAKEPVAFVPVADESAGCFLFA